MDESAAARRANLELDSNSGRSDLRLPNKAREMPFHAGMAAAQKRLATLKGTAEPGPRTLTGSGAFTANEMPLLLTRHLQETKARTHEPKELMLAPTVCVSLNGNILVGVFNCSEQPVVIVFDKFQYYTREVLINLNQQTERNWSGSWPK